MSQRNRLVRWEGPGKSRKDSTLPPRSFPCSSSSPALRSAACIRASGGFEFLVIGSRVVSPPQPSPTFLRMGVCRMASSRETTRSAAFSQLYAVSTCRRAARAFSFASPLWVRTYCIRRTSSSTFGARRAEG